MDLDIKIDKQSTSPIYKQVIEQITIAVRNGVLKSGDKLPPERELALQLDVARGTIKRAYEELERNKVIEVIQGSGSFVSKEQDVVEESRKERAIKLIDQMLDELESLKFTYREISTFINLRIREREEGLKKVRVATIDCNPEALSIFMRQLSYIKNLELSRFLLDDVLSYKKSVDILKWFDIIITTSNHYHDLCREMPELTNRIIQAAVSLSRQTIIDLATIPEDENICILCTSDMFLNIIREHLKGFNIDLSKTYHVFEKDMDYLQDTLRNCTTLIVPPGFFVEKGEYLIEIISGFKEKGGKIINFEYQIERGSMMYIEEQISNALNNKGSAGTVLLNPFG
ncbi:MAG TPA: GntR family transcriptional regulator [Clostridiaceae bacterium]|nr:GntR family transcriptional regulator [Clostridiaceae bacterium]